MAFHILDEIKKTPKSEWPKLAKDRLTRARIWIQENGEAAFVVGLILGFLLVAFYKVFIALIAIATIVGCSLYLLSSEGDEVSAMSDTVNGQISPEPEEAASEGSEEDIKVEKEESSSAESSEAEASGQTIH